MKRRFSFIGCFLSLFFLAVSLSFYQFVFHALTGPTLPLKLTFLLLNFLILIALASFWPLLAQRITVPMLSAVSVVTALYTVGQAILTVVVLPDSGLFLSLELLLLLLYFAVTLPLIKVGLTLARKN